MNTKRMIADISNAIEELVSEKTSLLDRIKAIDDNITAYRMAVESLELTIAKKLEPDAEKPEETPPVDDRFTRKTIVEFAGRKQRLSAWAKEFHIHPDTLKYRMNMGMEIKTALSADVHLGKRLSKAVPKKVFAYDPRGNVIRQYVNIGDAARDLKLDRTVIEKMLNDISIADQIASRNFYIAYAS